MQTLQISGSIKHLDEAVKDLITTHGAGLVIHHIVRFKNEYLIIFTP